MPDRNGTTGKGNGGDPENKSSKNDPHGTTGKGNEGDPENDLPTAGTFPLPCFNQKNSVSSCPPDSFRKSETMQTAARIIGK